MGFNWTFEGVNIQHLKPKWMCVKIQRDSKDGLNFVSLYFQIRTSDKYDMA